MVSLVNQNHERYANKWGYEHRIQTGNLVAGECLDPDSGEAVDCAPYWNKIVFFRKWLNEPKACPRREEWHLFMDSDMVVTNQNISLETVIEAFQKTQESLIHHFIHMDQLLASKKQTLSLSQKKQLIGIFLKNSAVLKRLKTLMATLLPPP